MQYFQDYIDKIKSFSFEDITEHSHRSALQTVLEEIAGFQKNNVKILHEPKREGKFGAPDYKILNAGGITGYIENKKIGENLDKIIKTEQIKKYRELSDNILLTNYLDFVWLKGESIYKASLLKLNSDLTLPKFETLAKSDTEGVQKLIENFFSQAPIGISTAKELAVALAARAKNLKNFLEEELAIQQKDNSNGLLFGLYETFKAYIFTDLSISEFADAFAQMLVYGLFQAKLNADTQQVTLLNAKKFIPQSFKLIQELVGFLDELNKPEYANAKWIIDEVISLMNNLDLPELQKTMLFSKTVKDNENIDTDPYIYFYETFLAAYNKNLRKAKGVYYTPPQVVNLIVNSINNILQNTFKIKAGFSDRKQVTVLDFATGTGTFLIEIFKLILSSHPLTKFQKDTIISKHILKNIYGFEYLIAPYTIAHLKLAQFLKEQSYEIKEKERLQIFLTNTLEPTDPQVRIPLLPALTQEARDAQAIKDKPILVITGNPPYSGHSKNTGEWISNLLRGNDIHATKKIGKQANYFELDGKPIKERNSKWLQDDYVKFIRFAQHKIDKAGQGVVGIITNNSFLDNPTFRGMRQSLMQTFNQMYFIDLHGNSRRKEKTPEGKPDKNVFEIMQGVCISLFIKKKGLKKAIYHADFWGTRDEKFKQCLNNTLQTIDWQEVKPSKPFYMFKPQNKILKEKYYNFWKITDIFKLNSVGIVTGNDDFFIDFSEKEIKNRIERVKRTKLLHQQQTFSFTDNFFAKRESHFKQVENQEQKILKINYRPFDERYIWHNEKLLERSRSNVMRHFIGRKNIGLISIRRSRSQNLWNFIFVSDKIISGATAISSLDINYFFPLYIYQQNGNSNGNGFLFKNEEKRDNFTKQFREFIKTKYSKKAIATEAKIAVRQKIKQKEEGIKSLLSTIKTFESAENNVDIIKSFKDNLQTLENQVIKLREQLKQSQITAYQPAPEEIMGYIYAVLHSETFRNSYSAFLKIDFPHIPFVDKTEDFKKLSKAGWELMQVHLQNKKPKKYDRFGLYKGAGDNVVEKPEHKNERLYINKTQYFDEVPAEVFEFYIGGYQVLSKYLKYRKNNVLKTEEIENIEAIVKIILWTIEQKKLIDQLLDNELVITTSN